MNRRAPLLGLWQSLPAGISRTVHRAVMIARRLGLALCLGCLGAKALAAEPEVDPKDLPRIPPVEPDKALATFRIKPGFRLELVAAEPLVVDPIAMAFDENGRLFVVEMRDYPEQRDAKLGRIRLLEDTDGDGRFDKSTVFADHLPWPTAVICYDGGVFVGATPDIIYFKDTDGDGVADERKVVFTGFGQGLDKLNVQQLLNGFTWGLDHRIHGAAGGNGGSITSARAPAAKPLELRGRYFSFDPRTLDLRAEGGGGQYGLSFDNHGRKFVCSNSSHIQTLMYAERYAARNPFYTMPRPLVEIAVDGPAAARCPAPSKAAAGPAVISPPPPASPFIAGTPGRRILSAMHSWPTAAATSCIAKRCAPT